MDSKHQTVKIELHRFLNPAGVPFSAIYEGEYEAMSCERAKEADMVKTYADLKFAHDLATYADPSFLEYSED